MKRLAGLLCLCCATTSAAFADNFLYGNNATFGAPYVFKIDKTTGAILDTYTNLSSSNGRGVVVVGDTMYYTSASSPSVFSYTLSTHTNNGAVFTVAGASALSTIAYDGTNLIIGDYSGTDNVYTYSTSGALLSTVALSKCTGDCDGLEYFQQNGSPYLVENEGDAQDPYDQYALDGTLVKAGFITPTNVADTGIAFDGTDFYTSEIYNGKLDEFDASGNFVQTITLTGAPAGSPPLIEDLSADYSTVLPPPPSTTPEPSSLMLLGTGSLTVAGLVRRRFYGARS